MERIITVKSKQMIISEELWKQICYTKVIVCIVKTKNEYIVYFIPNRTNRSWINTSYKSQS